jgi:hypothetical protein
MLDTGMVSVPDNVAGPSGWLSEAENAGRVVRSRDIQVQPDQKWVGGSTMGPRRHSEHEGLSAGVTARASVGSCAQAAAATVVC